jgi:hypothetical protein
LKSITITFFKTKKIHQCFCIKSCQYGDSFVFEAWTWMFSKCEWVVMFQGVTAFRLERFWAFLTLQLYNRSPFVTFFTATIFQKRPLNAHKRLGTVNGLKRFILYMINCPNCLQNTRSRFKDKRIAARETCFLMMTI